jgi:hypothetical protein
MRRAERVDVMILAEGTYPFVKGGVSSWIHQLITGLPHKSFGICFVGSKASDYGEIQYALPDNLVHIEIHYLFQEIEDPPPKKLHLDDATMRELEMLHRAFKTRKDILPPMMRNVEFFEKTLTFDHFLHAKETWEFIRSRYYEKAADMPFVDYFWAVRNMHRPIWIIADIVKGFPEVGVYHAPSTGYGDWWVRLPAISTMCLSF